MTTARANACAILCAGGLLLVAGACRSETAAEAPGLTLGIASDERLERGFTLGAEELNAAARLLQRTLEIRTSDELPSNSVRVVDGDQRVTIRVTPAGESELTILPSLATRARALARWSALQGFVHWSAVTECGRGGNMSAAEQGIEFSDSAPLRLDCRDGSLSLTLQDGAAARVVAWHPTLFRFGATQLNQRFERRFGEPAGELEWAGWVAVKIAGEALLRQAEGESLEDSLRMSRFDGQKGEALYFGEDGELVQPLYVVIQRDGEVDVEQIAMQEGE